MPSHRPHVLSFRYFLSLNIRFVSSVFVFFLVFSIGLNCSGECCDCDSYYLPTPLHDNVLRSGPSCAGGVLQ